MKAGYVNAICLKKKKRKKNLNWAFDFTSPRSAPTTSGDAPQKERVRPKRCCELNCVQAHHLTPISQANKPRERVGGNMRVNTAEHPVGTIKNANTVHDCTILHCACATVRRLCSCKCFFIVSNQVILDIAFLCSLPVMATDLNGTVQSKAIRRGAFPRRLQ